MRLFALIALEKFGITGQNKEKIMSSGRNIHKILQGLAKELQTNEKPSNLSDNYTRRRQLKFCVEWALKNTFGMFIRGQMHYSLYYLPKISSQ